MKLLLHICCAPCTIHPFASLKERDFDSVTGFYYNPNIHPYTEYKNRRSTLEEYSKNHKVDVIFHKYDIENFFRRVSGHEELGVRCAVCWRLRLEETARYASKNAFTHFTTTLLVSPYQDKEAIRAIGDEAAAKYGVEFVYEDFTGGFEAAQDKAKEENLYRQKYCGCVYSERERFEKKRSET